MLQQTRVEVVVPYYERFLERFPDVHALARASQTAVLNGWAGLGYYSRARNLHAAAERIVSEHGGSVPRGAEELAALPGIGRYTAGAIRSIAFGEPAPILDGNVTRVFARLFGLDADVDSGPARQQLWTWATQWAAGRDPGAANQSLMELGATLCTKPIPRCDTCPLSATCVARRTGRERQLPLPRVRAVPERVDLEAVLTIRRGRLLLVKRSSGRLLRDWWELPACRAERRPSGATTATRLQAQLGIEVGPIRPLARIQHGILNHRLDIQLLSGPARDSRASARPIRRIAQEAPRSFASLDHDALDARWVTAATCRTLPLSTLTRKALRAASLHDPRWSQFLPRRSR